MDGGGNSDAPSDAVSMDVPAGCELAKEPKDSPACVDSAVGVFVDAAGSDANPGTKDKPVQTIGAALKKTSAALARVYVCEGTYAEDVVLDQARDGVSIWGGFKCGAWSYSGGKPVVGKGKLAMKLEGLSKPIVVGDLEARAQDGDQAERSSIAALVSGSANVTFVRVKLAAGKGASGATGTLTPHMYPTQMTLNGKNAMGNSPGADNQVTCPGGAMTTGGAGGSGGGQPGVSGQPSLGGGQGGTAGSCGSTGTGKDGANAPAAMNAPVLTKLGTLSASGWAPASGAKGSDGGPGQGGGGGYGSGGGGGGGGGAGGCGGAGGGGGGGGGASIALATFASTVTLRDSALAAMGAGDGGAGVAGQTGQSPGGFAGNGQSPGCAGGLGGTGGNGGAGSGGAGGLSVGVLYAMTMPALDTATMSQITVANKGGAKGAGGAGNDGIDGVAQAVMMAP
jgi:hypothetical protein